VVLLAQLTAKARECLEFPETTPVHLWTDSTVALAWIRSDPSRWREFIGNRVSLIQELLPRAVWHHVAGEENPADVASAVPLHLSSRIIPLGGVGRSGFHLSQRCGRALRLLSPRTST